MVADFKSTPFEQRASFDLPYQSASETAPALSLTVVFTTVSGTLDALRKAAQLAHRLGARIQILITQVVPYSLPIANPAVDPEFRTRQFRTLCEQEPIETRLDVRLCRDAQRCILESLRPHSLIVIGVRRSWWPWTFEKRLAKSLARAGHDVVLAASERTR